jgi:hypothetical protein
MPPGLAEMMKSMGGPGGFDPSKILGQLGGGRPGGPDLSAMLKNLGSLLPPNLQAPP